MLSVYLCILICLRRLLEAGEEAEEELKRKLVVAEAKLKQVGD